MRSLFLHLAVFTAAVGCSSNEPSDDPSRCLQTYEFGNTGCGELAGLVTDGLGVPLAGAYVSVQGPADAARQVLLLSGYVQTDSNGTYRLRAIRNAGEVPAEGRDTVTVWVRAAVPPADDMPIGTPGPMDSVLAILEIRPVGEPPVTTEVATIVVVAP